MCRWIAYVGAPVYLEDFVSRPRQSLIVQSHRARESRTDVNGDGFGIGWYGDRQRPGIFRDIRPAWNDENLISIAHQIRSRLFFAHVRASTGTASTRANCHPFAVGSWLFMHNGQIGGYARIKRRIEHEIPDDLFDHRTGTTDSEAFFLLMLAQGLDRDPAGALDRAIAIVEDHMRAGHIDEPFKLTAAFTNGETLYAVRYATDGEPPTLYTRALPDGSGMLVVSEPLDEGRDGWEPVPAQHCIMASPRNVAHRAMTRSTILAAAT
jgi:glutamine amidotransferase